MTIETAPSDELLSAALADPARRGKLLEHCESYLRGLARAQFDRRLQAREAASDVVQETLLEAHRDFGQFRGEKLPEFLAWLRQVLQHNLARAADRHVGAAKRDVRRERSLDQPQTTDEQPIRRLAAALRAGDTSPSRQAMRQEELVALADALTELPPDYYEVVTSRHLEGLPFAEIARRLDRSEGAVRMIWFRALDRLRSLLKEKGVL